ncbi:hypothetical protein LTR84_008302 [Exophiala bonariae]|uniref:VOC domain-containing protein n=1 Tax=Exophiala bonariae TaxID=1690606 RepID=A0AAV9MYE3_9EURO|nr:hypothetical protein LTR84_008302 [Exophiala bonariae]
MPITGLAHINLTVPPGTLPLAVEFYSGTLGLKPREVPHLQKDSLAWFDIADSGQQVHVAFEKESDLVSAKSSRHPCFKLSDGQALLELRRKVYEHFERGGESAPVAADKPGAEDSGAKGVEYPQRFFARDYAGNRLEFSL